MQIKKIIAPGLLIIAVAAMSSCDKAKIDVNFNMDVANIYFTIDTTSETGQMDFDATSFNSELQKTLDNNKASIDDVESIELTGAQFKNLTPGQNFDIVTNASAFLSAASVVERRIAYKDPVPDGVTSFELTTDGGNLKDYLKQSVVNFKASGLTSGPNTVADSLQAILSFKIKAKVKP